MMAPETKTYEFAELPHLPVADALAWAAQFRRQLDARYGRRGPGYSVGLRFLLSHFRGSLQRFLPPRTADLPATAPWSTLPDWIRLATPRTDPAAVVFRRHARRLLRVLTTAEYHGHPLAAILAGPDPAGPDAPAPAPPPEPPPAPSRGLAARLRACQNRLAAQTAAYDRQSKELAARIHSQALLEQRLQDSQQDAQRLAQAGAAARREALETAAELQKTQRARAQQETLLTASRARERTLSEEELHRQLQDAQAALQSRDALLARYRAHWGELPPAKVGVAPSTSEPTKDRPADRPAPPEPPATAAGKDAVIRQLLRANAALVETLTLLGLSG
jgi:hypothetical protein